MLRRRIASAALLCVTALSLTGCIRFELTAHVDQNGGITKVDFVYGLNKDAGSTLNGFTTPSPGASDSLPTDLESFKQSLLSGDTNGVLAKACTFSETSSEFVANCSMTKAQFDSSGSQTGDTLKLPTFTRDGKTLKVSYTPTSDSQLSGMSPAAAAAMGVKFTQTYVLPGPVSQVKGAGASVSSTDPNALVIDQLKVKTGETISAVSTLPSKSVAALIAIIAGLAVLALIVVAAFVMIRRRRKAFAEPEAPIQETGSGETVQGVESEPPPMRT